jgi:hypothetical protein
MLVSEHRHGVRAHAAFQAQALIDGADLARLPRRTIDLDMPPAAPDKPPPF